MFRRFLRNLQKLLTFYKNSVLRLAEYYDKYGDVPTAQSIMDLLSLSEEHLEAAENLADKEKLLWYFDRFLPAIAGEDNFGTDKR